MRGLPLLKPQAFNLSVLAAFVVLVYFPTLSGGFILDDKPLIQNNLFVKESQSIISYLSQEDGAGSGYYRPLINFTYWLDFAIWGMNGARFRASNLFYHLVTCILFFQFMNCLTGNRVGSFWIAALFAVHPVNTEAVSWVSSRNNILVAAFGLASFGSYMKAQERGRAGYASLSLLLFAGALFSKEFGLILLPIFILWNFNRSSKRWSISPFLRDHLPFVIIIIAYLLIRFSVTTVHGFSVGEEPLWRRILLAPYLIFLNAGMILLPLNLHSFTLRYPTEIFPWQGAVGFLFLAFLCILFQVEKEKPLLRFAICSFVLSLLPVLNIISLPSPSLVSMRWLYFPMLFFLIGVSPTIFRLLEIKPRLTPILLAVVMAYLGFYTHILNRNLWHDEKTFFSQEVSHFKNDYYSSGFAEVLYQEGDFLQAEEQFAVAIREGHATAKDMINYSALLIDRNKCDAALGILEKAQRQRMSLEEMAEFHNNMGMACFRLNRSTEAIGHFKKAVIYSPQKTLFWSNLAGAYGNAGDHGRSVVAFKRGLETDPRSVSVRKGLALAFINMRDYTGAVSVLKGIPSELADREVKVLLNESRSKMEDSERPAEIQKGIENENLPGTQ